MASDARRAVGALGERLAADYLVGAGYRVLDRNFRTRHGELDLVAAGERCLVFCEVKTRVAGSHGGPPGPLDAVGAGKRRRVRLMAAQWLVAASARAHRPLPEELRFDAIGITVASGGALESLEHVRDAF